MPAAQGNSSAEQVPSSPRLRLWTIQSSGWWQALEGSHALGGDGRRVRRFYRPAYRWLMQQMKLKLPACSGRFPVWLWHSPKPDLRRGGHLPPGTPGVRVELELPAERVLLLDFETWHCVLNRWHLSLSWRESRQWDRKVKPFGYFDVLPADLEAELRLSWERVFDLEALKAAKMWGPVDRVQAVTEYVRRDEVRRVDAFVAR